MIDRIVPWPRGIAKALLLAGIILGVFGAASRNADAFPFLAVHGYVNCTSCHVSPAGGGALNPYGRQLSGELLSTWAKEEEGGFAEGYVKLPSWLNVGGDLRAVEIYRSTPQARQFRFLDMQEDVEAAASYRGFTADVSAGLYMEQPQARRFFLGYQPTDEVSFRVGKFRYAYGLMEADHTTPIQRGLGRDENTESYNLEAAWLGEKLNFYLTADFGTLDNDLISASARERGGAARLGIPFAESSQAGLSFFHGVSQNISRDVVGPFGILGLTRSTFLLTEFDLQNRRSSTGGVSAGWVTWSRLDYEFIQGLHGYLTYGLTRPDFKTSTGKSTNWGIGSQWFPRPHFEFQFLWQFQSVSAFQDATLQYGTLLLHYYL
jgi:hypothetical protein